MFTLIALILGLKFGKFDDMPVFVLTGAVLDAFWIIPLLVKAG